MRRKILLSVEIEDKNEVSDVEVLRHLARTICNNHDDFYFICWGLPSKASRAGNVSQQGIDKRTEALK